DLYDITGTIPSLVSTYTGDAALRAALFAPIHNLLYVVEQTSTSTLPEIVSYSADYSTGKLTKASTYTLKRLVSLMVGTLALSPDGNTLYAAGYDIPSGTTESVLEVLSADPQTHALMELQNVLLPLYGLPVHLIVAAPPG